MSSNFHQIRFPLALAGVKLANKLSGVNPPATRPSENVQSPAGSELDVAGLFAELFERIDELESRRRDIADELNHIAVDLAVTVSEKVLHQQLDTDSFPVAHIVETILKQTQWTEPLTVMLNPVDLDLLKKQVAATDSPMLKSLKLAGEPGFPRGRCHVSAGEKGNFYDTSLQLAEIRQRLLEKLNEAEIERRSPGTSDSELRRFPERRATG